MGYYSVTAEYAQKALRAGGAGPEGFQTEGYEYPVGYLVYGFDSHTLCQLRITNSLNRFVRHQKLRTSGGKLIKSGLKKGT